jgi:CheY-like chemotaxis protein
MEVLSAESGREGIEILQKAPDVDVVLLDIMALQEIVWVNFDVFTRVVAYR